MRLAIGLQVSLIATALVVAHTEQTAIRNSSLIGFTVAHRPAVHCSNGTERAFLIDVSKQSPEPVPVSPELTSPLDYPLILDAKRQLLFANSENHDPTILPHSNSEFYGWLGRRSSIMVLRGEFSSDVAQQAFLSAAQKGFSDEACGLVNNHISYDGYVLNLGTNRKTSPTLAFRSRGNGLYLDNEGLQPLKSQRGIQVGWIFRSIPQGEMWATDMDGWNAARIISGVGNHGCRLSPRDPILACEGMGADSKTVEVLKVKLTILGGSYWAAAWAPDGSAFLNRDDPTKPYINYYAVDRTTHAVSKPVPVMVQGWTPIICCNGKDGWPRGTAGYQWSSDSQWILYSATSAGTGKVILRVSRRNPQVFQKLTENIVRDAAYPEQSPDGKYLAFLSTGIDPKPEPGACPAGNTTEWNVQLYTICLTCSRAKRGLRQITHLGCNSVPSGAHWMR
jgi:hypothetical protein